MRFWRSFLRLPTVCRAALCILALPRAGLALAPEEILVVANEKANEGIELARYYARLRGIQRAARGLKRAAACL